MIADADAAARVISAAERVEGVDSATAVTASGRPGAGAPLVVDGRVRIDVTPADAADGDAAVAAVTRLRDSRTRCGGADTLVGGCTAQRYETRRTAAHDRTLIVPVVLAVILAILVGLLRSLLMPLLLVATVALDGAGRHPARLPGADRLHRRVRRPPGHPRRPLALVPALVRDLGPVAWWPGRLSRAATGPEGGDSGKNASATWASAPCR